ncbi:MAG: hypothetical protein M0Z77_02315 [Thermoplasmatales archaeon]|jgi:hypothetical protein|nr:hypothetical protein [Candidatus Thermoplasmatota archaeon]MDA8054471.1 hypothetical protein [Thermoplasmatales archaeon]
MKIEDKSSKSYKSTYAGILKATSLFGFSSSNRGFPILTSVKEFSSITRGLFVFPVYLVTTSAMGFLYSRVKIRSEID